MTDKVPRSQKEYGLPPLTFEEAARVLQTSVGALMEFALATLRPSEGRWSLWKSGKESLPEAIIRLWLERGQAIESVYHRELRELKAEMARIAAAEAEIAARLGKRESGGRPMKTRFMFLAFTLLASGPAAAQTPTAYWLYVESTWKDSFKAQADCEAAGAATGRTYECRAMGAPKPDAGNVGICAERFRQASASLDPNFRLTKTEVRALAGPGCESVIENLWIDIHSDTYDAAHNAQKRLDDIDRCERFAQGSAGNESDRSAIFKRCLGNSR